MDNQAAILHNLQAGAVSLACGGYLKQLPSLQLTELLLDLGYDRLRRKHDFIEKLYFDAHEDWNQTLYTLLLRSMAALQNREAYMQLAQRVPYDIILRERLSLRSVEALLIGASGLLATYPDDDYIRALKSEFQYLQHKYELQPMTPAAWRLSSLIPFNHPVLRLAQVAAFVTDHELVLNDILECRTPQDVERLFGVEASEYWTEHYTPADNASTPLPKRIGHIKSELVGINLVAQLQFAYGIYLQNEALRDRAISLLEALHPENNLFMRTWARYGLHARNAFDSQALLQLATEYCRCGRCAVCPVGKRILKSSRDAL